MLVFEKEKYTKINMIIKFNFNEMLNTVIRIFFKIIIILYNEYLKI